MSDDLDTSGAVGAYLGGQGFDPAVPLRQTMRAAVDANPDFEAQLQQAARRTGVSALAARTAPEEVQRAAKVQALDLEGLVRDFPQTASYMLSEDNARVAHDDVGTLKGIESAVGSAVSYVMGARPDGGLPGDIGGMAKSLAGGLWYRFPAAFYGALAYPAEAVGADNLGGFLRNESAALNFKADQLRGELPENPLRRGLYSGMESVGLQAPTMPFGFASQAGEKAMLFMMGLSQFGQSYVKGREAGQAPGAAGMYGLEDAVAEVITERFMGASGLVKDAKAGMSAGAVLVRDIMREVPGEMAATVWQNFNEWQNLHPGKSLADFLREQPEALAETVMATIVGAGAQTGAAHGLAKAADRIGAIDLKAAQAERRAEALAQLTQLAETSKLRERDPENFRAFMQEVTEAGMPNLYIDPKALAQAGVDLREVAQAMPSIAPQVQAAIQTGGDLVIPTAEFATAAPGQTFAQALIEHARTAPDAMSRAEAQVYMQEQGDRLQAEIQRVLTEKQGDDQFKAMRDQVRDHFAQQLDQVQRFTPDVNQAYATMLGNFYAVTAARLGITPTELLERYPLRVAAEGVTGGLEQGNGAAEVLLALGKREGLYQYPKSGAKDLVEIAKEKSPKLAVYPETITQMDGTEKPTGFYSIKLPSGKRAQVQQRDGKVWVNAAGVGEGKGGSLLYDLVANYAHNNGLKFIGDPDGLSDAGMRRRLENMLSSAVKYGTTDHLEPHPRQLRGEVALGLPPLAWAEGDTLANLQSMLQASVAGNEHNQPAGSSVTFDPAAGAFRDSEGNVLEDAVGALTALASDQVGERGAGAAGEATLRRRALFASLLRSPEARRELLARLRDESQDGSDGAGRGLEGSFYQGVGQRGAFDPKANVIALFKGADLSTFIHESGHFFLEVQADLAARIQGAIDEGATVSAGEREIVEDMSRLLEWFGVKATPERTALQAWHDMTLDEKRQYHEQFARGFEAYAFDGRAPSTELQSLFQRFRAWMVNVYRQLKALNVTLTDEVRGVMDRMLASGEQIQEAEAARQMGALFETPEQAGMTAEEFKAYHDLAVDATQQAIENLQARGLRDMQWLQNARSRALKKLQAQHDELRREVEREVRAEVMAQPIYQAWQFLTQRGERVKAGELDVTQYVAELGQQTGKLRTSAVEELNPEQLARLKELRMVQEKDGLHPDVVAELFGYTSGDEMIRQLVAVDPPRVAIEGMTDQRMLERYGDLATPEGLQRAADEAIHSEARARFLATELAAVERAQNVREKVPGRKSTVDVLAREAKAIASAVLSRLKVRDIRPAQYAAAEVRAARAAEKAMKADDLAEVAAQKRNQLIQNQATKQAYEAQDEVRKTLDYLRRFEKRPKSVDPAYLDQIEALLERFDLKPASLKAVDRRKTLAAWVEAQREQGLEPDVPPELLDEAQRKSWRDMTLEELRGLRDTVKQIEHLGKLKNRLLTAAEKRDFESVRDEIASSITDNAGKREADTRTPATTLGRALKAVKDFGAAHIKAATWARIFDGGKDGGPVWEYLIRAANERGDMETTMRAKATAELHAIVAPLLADGKMGGKGKFFATIKRSMNREQVLAMALNTGNEGNWQRMLGGEGWTAAQVQPVLATLTAKDWQAVQAVWDHFESYRPLIGAKERRVYGKEPNWVEPVPREVQTADGQVVKLRGGYYPIKYDPLASNRAEQHNDAEAAKRQLQGAYTSATTRRGFTKARAEEVNGRPLLYSLAGVYSGVNDVIHDLAWHEWLIDANKILRSDKIDQAIRQHYGPAAVRQLKTWSDDIAAGDQSLTDALDKAFGMLRHGVSVAGLGFNVMSAAMQPLGLSQSIVRVGAKWVGIGVGQYVAAPIAKTREVNEKSDFMAGRARTRFRELNELRNQVEGQTKVRELTGRYAYVLMMRFQQAVDVPTWLGAYEKAISEGNKEERAVALADQAVIDAQGGGQTKDLSAIERGPQWKKLFTTFYSFMNTALNVGVAQGMTSKNAAKTAVDMLLLYSVPAVLGALLKDALTPGDAGDEDKLLKKLLAEQLGYLMGLFVVAREFAEAAKTAAGLAERPRDYSGPAGVRVVADAATAAKQVQQGEFDDSFRKAMVNLAGDLFALPSAQINRTITGIQALKEGKTSNPAALVFGFQEPH